MERDLKAPSLLDCLARVSPLPTIEQTPNRFLASISQLDLEHNPIEKSFSAISLLNPVKTKVILEPGHVSPEQLSPEPNAYYSVTSLEQENIALKRRLEFYQVEITKLKSHLLLQRKGHTL